MLLTLLSFVLSQFCLKHLHCLSFASCWFILYAKPESCLFWREETWGSMCLLSVLKNIPSQTVWCGKPYDHSCSRTNLFSVSVCMVRTSDVFAGRGEKPTKPSLLHVYYWAWRRQFSVNVLHPQIYSYSTVLATRMEVIHGSHRGSSHQTLHFAQLQQGVITRKFPLREIH